MMEFKLYNVNHGSSSFLLSPTGMSELIDFGGSVSWSPLLHVFQKELGSGGILNRMVVSHHHGDHLNDIFNIGKYRPATLQRRKLEGDYEKSVKDSNSEEGIKAVTKFEQVFANYTAPVDPIKFSEGTWGMKIERFSLSMDQAKSVSGSPNSIVNNSSYVSLYTHNTFKLLAPGDMEKEGMKLLLDNSIFKDAVKDVKVLIAPHHGHKSGFSTELMNAIEKPQLVLASMMKGDEHVDTRYSSSDYVQGISNGKKLMTTRTYGLIHISIDSSGGYTIRTSKDLLD